MSYSKSTFDGEDRMNEEKAQRAVELYRSGLSYRYIAVRLGVTIEWVSHYLKESGVKWEGARVRRQQRESLMFRLKVTPPMMPTPKPIKPPTIKERGRIGDLRDSVDKAYWRVCG